MTTLGCLSIMLLLVVMVGSCPDRCLFCISGTKCTLCAPSFVLATDASCIPLTVPSCRLQLNASSCAVCEPTFQTAGGICVKDYSGCLMRSPTGECRYCGFGTRLAGSGCVGVLNCQSYNPIGQCILCMSGYSLAAGSCNEARPACAAKSGGVCSQCQNGYVMNGFSCLPATIVPPGCAIYNYVSGRCFICSEGYDIYHKYCQRKDRIPFFSKPQQTPTNALKMQDDSLDITSTSVPTASIASADSIVQDYTDISIRVASGQGKPVVGDQKCWQRNKAGLCVLCFEGFTMVNQLCVKAPPLCLLFSGKLCAKCVPELKLKQGNCVDDNCAVPIFSRCAQCLPKYAPNDRGVCVNNNCASFQQGVCNQCAQGYTLSTANLCLPATTPTTPPTTPSSQATTKPSTGIQTIIGCDLVVNGACGRCGEDYYPNGKGGCKKVIIGCLQYDPPEITCLSCIPIYTKTAEGNCVYQPAAPTPTLISIPTTPSFTNVAKSAPTSSTVVPVIGSADENCLVRNNGSCAICKTRYRINLFTFACQPVAKECLTFNPSNGTCLSCTQGYNIFLGWCLGRFNQTDPNCLVRDINNYCSSCQPQFFINQGRCLPIDTQCRSLNVVGGGCTACYAGYVVFNGKCLPLSLQPTCLAYDFQSNCLTCANRYVLLANVCTPVSPLCSNYHPQTAACIDCVSGLGLSSITGGCQAPQPPPPNCQNADPVGNCIACLPRFYFNTTKTCLPASPLCAKFENIGGKCLGCVSNYAMLADASCVQANLTSGCKSADPSGLCTVCIGQYVLINSGSCLLRDTNCVSYDEWGNCSKCVIMFYVAQGKCLKQVLKNKDPNCRINDLLNYCVECNSGYYISAGNCLLADQLCRTFDPANGNCLTCYPGYKLTQYKCFLGAP